MSHTNETANLGLPQFIDTDQPTWLGDVNVALQKIDTKAGAQDGLIDGAAQNASAALNIANQASATANAASSSAISAHEEAVLAEGIANNALTVANNTAALAQKLVKTELWKNDTIAVGDTFAGQTVTLSESIENFKECEILFALSTSTISTIDRINVAYGVIRNGYVSLDTRVATFRQSYVELQQRVVNITGTSAVISDGVVDLLSVDTGQTSESSNNAVLIPVAIYGYNTLDL